MRKNPFSVFLAIFFSCSLIFPAVSCAQPLGEKRKLTHQDTLRGSITPERGWWDVMRYDIYVRPEYGNKTISGNCKITFEVLKDPKLNTKDLNELLARERKMQIDLQMPLVIDSVIHNLRGVQGSKRSGFTLTDPIPTKLAFNKIAENVYLIMFSGKDLGSGEGYRDSITIYYHGKPTEAVRPPWDGGWIWKKDEKGRPWMSVACQGTGASVWYPCKDHQSDEPNEGASLSITVVDTLVAVANGRLKDKKMNNDNTATYTWAVVNPINNYNIIPYIGKYVNWHEDYSGEKGKLDCDYYVLDYNLDKAKEQFKQVPKMLKCLEYWFGPYPFYEDGYKIVESPHLGMEHQSAIAYGNRYRNGYLGKDLSGSGWGEKWDFIIVHESAHEWFANNITTNDIADMWVHESFANYSEALFVECEYGKAAATDYVVGIRKLIQNDIPIIGTYGVNQEGSGDMYYKGGNLLHTIRATIGDDEKFRQILRGLNKEFYHKTVTTQEIEKYISKKSGIDFSKVFDQYLRKTQIPTLEYYFIADKKNKSKLRLYYRWIDCVKGFNMPVRVNLSKSEQVLIKPEVGKAGEEEEDWKSISTSLDTPTDPDRLPDIRNRDYYIKWIENRKIVPPGKHVRD